MAIRLRKGFCQGLTLRVLRVSILCFNSLGKENTPAKSKPRIGSPKTNDKPNRLLGKTVNEKPKLEKAISMPLFFSNQRKQAGRNEFSKSPEKLEQYNTELSNSKNFSLANESMSRDAIQPVVNKLPAKLNKHVDAYSLFGRNNKYCM